MAQQDPRAQNQHQITIQHYWDALVTFIPKQNSRKRKEIFVEGKHLSVPELTERMNEAANKKELDPQLKMLEYLNKVQQGKIPTYPNPVKFVVANLIHVTDRFGFEKILESEQFRAPLKDDSSWWSLYIDSEEIKSAEKRYLEKNFPNRAQQTNNPEPFLHRFTTSPVFMSGSRYGNYRFRFPLAEVMERYKEQNCDGMEPVLRVYKSVTYRQEIMYVVLIHSPHENKLFNHLPLLEESEWVSYQDGQITWKAQAICGTHRYKLSPELTTEPVYDQYYVWDHACLAFHIPGIESRALRFSRRRLIEALDVCTIHDINLARNYNDPEENNESKYAEAVQRVQELKQELES